MSTCASTHACRLPPRAAAGYGAGLIAQPLNAMLLSGVPPWEHRFVGKLSLSRQRILHQLVRPRALEWLDTSSDGIAMPPTSNPPEKMMFQLNLRRRGISDQAVLRVMEEIPRDIFVEVADRADAYRDSALGIACGQTISQPFVVAYMTEQLQLQKHHRVLEIGTGSGYQAAILSRLSSQVLTIERYRTLADDARARLKKLGCGNVEVLLGDGFDIPADAGNFDRI